MDLLNHFEEYIISKKLIVKGDSLILGVSGGPDSMTMLDLFACLKEKYALEIVIFHLNHMFRKEAEEEALFVDNKAKDYGFDVFIKRFNVPQFIKKESISPEEGAREIRFRLLSKLADSLNIKKLAMAHNKDDLVETVLLNLFRGTGLKGLTGIDPISKNYGLKVIHPLLSLSRANIEYYCKKNNIESRIDPSNKETIYTRNKIRNLILPLIEEEINAGVKDVIYRMASNIREEEEFLQRYSDASFQDSVIKRNKKCVVLSLSKLQDKEYSIRRRIVRNAVNELQGNTTDLYSVHYKAIERLIISGETGKTIQLKDGNRVRSSYDFLIFEKDSINNNEGDFIYELSVPGEVVNNNFKLKAEIIDIDNSWHETAFKRSNCICDLDKIEFPLTVRNRREGDYFVPFGMSGSKKVKDFFIDEKISVHKRDKIPLVVDKSGKIIWIAGQRADDSFKVDDKTKKLLKLGIIFTGGD